MTPPVGTPRKLFDRKPPGIPPPYGWPAGFDVSADGEHLVFVHTTSEDLGEPSFAVVLNWFEESGD